MVDKEDNFPTEPIKILVVEDDAESRDFLRGFFLKEGFDVQTAEDGENGIALLEKKPFDIFFTDLKMPKADGLQAREAAKFLPFPPVSILFTGHADVDSAAKAMKLGTFDYIRKPLRLNVLKTTLKHACSQVEYGRAGKMASAKSVDGLGQLLGKSEGIISEEDLPDKMFESASRLDFSPRKVLENGIQFGTAVSKYEKELILHALKKSKWVKNRTAKMLGTNRTTLVKKMKKRKIGGSLEKKRPHG